MLQKPFYHPDNPAFMNYGGMGYVTAHELSHAFYYNNEVFDHDKNKIDCIVKQYEKYVPSESTQVSDK